MTDKVKTIRAASMPEALAKVKAALGPDAVILGTRTLGGEGVSRLMRRERVEITAAPAGVASGVQRGGDASGLKARVTGGSGSRTRASGGIATSIRANGGSGADGRSSELAADALESYFQRLTRNDVGRELARRILSEASRELPGGVKLSEPVVAEALRRHIARMLPTASCVAVNAARPRREAFVGPSGGGKSSCLAKLAARAKLVERRTTALLSLDVYRIGATEQLRRFAEILDVPLTVAATADEIGEALSRLGEVEQLWIDTPGVSLSDGERVSRMGEMVAACGCTDVHLVLPSCMSEEARKRAARVFGRVGVTDLVLTKLDDAMGFGVILNAADQLQMAVSYVSAGPNIPRDIMTGCGASVAELVLRSE